MSIKLGALYRCNPPHDSHYLIFTRESKSGWEYNFIDIPLLRYYLNKEDLPRFFKEWKLVDEAETW